MHICFITNEYPKLDFPHGGVGTFIHTFSQKLIEEGHRVSVVGINVYTKVDEEEDDRGIYIFRLKPRILNGLTWYLNNKSINKKLEEIHCKYPINIIETAELGLSFIKKNPKIKYVIRLHGGHHFFAESENRKVSWWKGFQEKKSFKNADAFIAVSDYVKTHTFKYLSLNKRPIEKINSPINLQHFQPLLNSHIPFKIVFVGTVCEKKGIRQLIQAMAFVFELFPDANLDIYGRDWFFSNGDSYIDMLKDSELLKLNSYKDRVVFKGPVDYKEIPKKYAESHVCVFPSHMETLGLVAPEAMCMAKPVVFTKEGPGPEVISHGKTGLLCDPYNPSDIAKQIKWVFKNPEAAKKMGFNARNSVLERFNIDLIVEKNISFYSRISKSN